MIKFENSTNGRYYYLYMHKDIFNELVITTIRGGRRNRIVQSVYFHSRKKALEEIERISKIRIKRGYRLVS